MISGPVTPRTRLGLRDFVRQRTQLLECGLVLVQEDVELGANPGGTAVVDALARDALGAPLFLFAASEESVRDLPSRILEVDGWFRRHGEALLRALADAGYQNGAQPRFLVVGFEIAADLAERLERLSIARLEALQICTFSLRGELHYDIEHVLPRGAAQELKLGTLSSIVDPRDRELCACMLDLMQRLDPRMTVTGDRFSRRFALSGAPLGMLRYDEGGLWFSLADQHHRIQCWDHVVDAVDLVLRSWHLGCRDAEVEESPPSSAETPVRPLARLEARISLDALRRSVAETKLTRAEFEALTNGESEAV